MGPIWDISYVDNRIKNTKMTHIEFDSSFDAEQWDRFGEIFNLEELI